ncbi:MAG: hypothetical protein SVK08_01710 [Halobacteriota archaeon]|nr:hypothetical protein [Halobacteriota archaeon]
MKRGWIGIKCLWCSDRSNHLGINLNSKAISCWKCPTKGTVLKLVMKLENLSIESAVVVLKEFSSVALLAEKFQRNLSTIHASELKFDPGFTSDIAPYCRRFLESRNFDPDYLFKKYGLMSAPITGKYKYCVIVPYYSFKTPITFIARHTAKKVYLNCPDELCTENAKQLLYGQEKCRDTVIVVEGVTDQWRIGDGSVALAGSGFTPRQVELLADFDRVFILFDPEDNAQQLAEKLQYLLVNHCHEVVILDLGVDHDPAELAPDDVKVLRNQVFSKMY